MEWSSIKIRCSSIGSIMTEPKEKGPREAGELSETAKTELVKIYNMEKYGRKKEITTKYMDKGNQVEPVSIELVGRIDKREYVKNETRFSNEFIQGTPDVVWHDGEDIEVLDTKSCWDLDSFQGNRHKKVNKDDYYQVLGYMALVSAKKAQVCKCLNNTPDSILNGELFRLQSRMDVATNENPEFKKAAAELMYNHIFDDIPEIERVIRIKYDFNEAEIEKVYAKVKKCRAWLEEFDKSPRIF